jgi:predicted AAA+ superfamily ATPase
MFIERHIDVALGRLEKSFPAVIITGARQVGKTTLLRRHAPNTAYVTLDDFVMLDFARNDPSGFIGRTAPPLIIDEIQYAPDLMRAIKMKVDESGEPGLFLLTGSQQFALMRGVSESLAGRVGILTLPGLSAREISGDGFNRPFLPSDDYLEERKSTARVLSAEKLWARIHRGCMPKLHADESTLWQDYWPAYVKTYIERDVRALSQVGNELSFMQFLTACAARTGQLLNLSDVAKDVGVSVPTAKRWLSILQISDIVYLLQPFSLNISARVVKTPKLYFTDTGLAAYLCRWLTPETLESGAMSGAIFETYVLGEIRKSYQNAGLEVPLYFYRDSEGREIDILVHRDGKLYPVEIKKTASPREGDARHFEALARYTTLEVASGGLVCTYDKALPLGKTASVIPIDFI